MSRAALARRVDALEAGPASLKTLEGWAEVYGWPHVWEWKKNLSRRAVAKLLPMLGKGAEPIPEETPLEHQFHQSMAAAYPGPDARNRLRVKFGLPPGE